MFKQNLKYLIGAGIAFYGYLYTYKNTQGVDLTNKYNLLLHLKLNSEQTILLNKKISSYTNKSLTTQILNSESLLPVINEKTKQVQLDLSLHRDLNNKDHFAKLNSEWIKLDKDQWKPNCMNIKFKNDTNWFKFYDDVKVENNLDYSFDGIKTSKLIHDSDELIKSVEKEPHILKAIDILLKDNQKLQVLGLPICLPFLYFNSYDGDYKHARVRIEGQSKNADYLITMVDSRLDRLSLVYDLDERLFTNRPLSSFSNSDPLELIKQRSDSKIWLEVFKQIELNKLVDTKLKNDYQKTNTLGEPIDYKYEIDQSIDISKSMNTIVKVHALGRLNKAELMINIVKETERWKVVDTKFKFLWNTNDS